jgi:transposase InsO family protein
MRGDGITCEWKEERRVARGMQPEGERRVRAPACRHTERMDEFGAAATKPVGAHLRGRKREGSLGATVVGFRV